MLTQNKIKIIKSLKLKKNRNKHGLFVVEGKKSVSEFLNSNFELDALYYVNDFANDKDDAFFKITNNQLNKISFLKNPNQVLAIFKISEIKTELKQKGLIVALDNVKDPGNLGTIIRLCDWFGVAQLVCSIETVDCYNEKVIQASMGSLTRLNIVYTNLEKYLTKSNLPKFATTMSGENIYKKTFSKDAIIIIGNEANGISNTVLTQIKNCISIPKFGDLQQTESLNVATATAIILSEFRR